MTTEDEKATIIKHRQACSIHNKNSLIWEQVEFKFKVTEGKMKRVAIVILVLTVCLATARIVSAGPAPRLPNTVCIQHGDAYLTLAIKAVSGSIQRANGSFKLYAVEALNEYPDLLFSYPLTGRGYMTGNVFHFNLTGWYRFLGTYDQITLIGHVDISTKAAKIHHRVNGGSEFNNDGLSVSCNQLNLPLLAPDHM